MNDTTPAVDAQLAALYRARTPAARLRMATAMFSAAKRLAVAGLRFGDGACSAVELRHGLLHRFYGDELTPVQRADIAARTPPG